ncbi:uncharacterized protein LOC141640958 [Silene latifolia]|uniref:uncharacterized protein LOC141640958 n=1 Tax=Silene latifolia TaxID=37657 RepID=UPI003D76D587
MNGGLNVKEKLFSWGCCEDDMCCLCNRETETAEQLFLACEYSCRVSNEVERWIGKAFPTVNGLISGNRKQMQWKVLTAILNAVYYNVWMQRNNARVNEMILRPELVAKQTRDAVMKRIKSKAGRISDQHVLLWMRNIGV